jgi:vanillate O-demethylase ferredoxin subunit
VAFNCGTGKCGVCEVGVIEGTPHHRNFALTDRERAGQSVMTCCSGSLSAELILDL